MMKKTLKTTLAVLMCAALLLGLCACGGGAPTSLKGTSWAVTKVSANGMDVEGELLASMGFEITLNFTSDSDYTMEALGESIDGTYTLSGNTLTLTVGSDSQDCTLSGNTFTMEEDGSKIIFTKK
jgi:hypothetical protein